MTRSRTTYRHSRPRSSHRSCRCERPARARLLASLRSLLRIGLSPAPGSEELSICARPSGSHQCLPKSNTPLHDQSKQIPKVLGPVVDAALRNATSKGLALYLLDGAPLEDYDTHGTYQNHEIHPNRPIAHVRSDQLYPLFVAGIIAPAYLPESCDPGSHPFI